MTRQKSFLREDIIDRAIDVFMTKGYEATSVKDLVDVTGLHPGSLYNAFGNKQNIYKAALERFDAMSPFNRLLNQADTAPPRQSIEQLLRGVVDPDGVAGCLITFAAAEVGKSDEELAHDLHLSFRRMEDRLCRFIERGQACGDFASKRDPRDLAQLLLSTVQGIQVMSKVADERAHLRAAADVALAALDQIEA